ncbi:oligopeptide ABC transporter ATP-binding protein [Entomoplasma ellychniae]|uniref:Oligopeptide ABC transporter ATP-binding protein n=1 Tax=Entomoplasma ellychniae TaxID=2114 RepID=A0A8E2QW24_9MOLU|nr:oligopeptide ABC transporter ATP-binding protein OppD [Entomoplasma ellychniae]PPE04746.1 oligopeptide ABC transporter ATP-binding protein [Entomoplasma ellychniae]
MQKPNKILSVKDVEVKFRVRNRILTAIRSVSFDLYDGEILAIVGESGSGKSVITKTFTGMLETNGWISEGSIVYKPIQEAIDDQKAFFKKPFDIANVEKVLIDSGVVSFVKKKNQKQTNKIKTQIKHILSLNPEETTKIVNKKELLEKLEIKINKLELLITDLNEKSLEFKRHKNFKKISKITSKINKCVLDKEIIINDEKRNELISNLNQKIIELEVDTMKVRKMNNFEKNTLRKVIAAIEAFIDSDIAISESLQKQIDNYFTNKSFLSNLEFELKAIYDQIINHKTVDKEHFINLMFDWDQISKNYITNKKNANKSMRELRGKTIATIFQDPMTSLNPLLTVGFQITEILRRQSHYSREEAKKQAIILLEQVGIPDAKTRYKDIPGQYSGGMRQRVVIAIALACKPKILICDEPTTALDVTIQAQILKLIKDLQKIYKFSVIFITHDLGVVASIADRVAVMYAGQIVEIGTSHEIFKQPKHPYTWALLLSLPQLGTKGERIYSIAGTPPSLFNEIKGDAFAPRNKHALAIDYIHEPPMFKVTETHYAKTWLLHDNSKKVEPPKEILERIKKGS